MNQAWSKITDSQDAKYDANNPFYELPWYGAQNIPEIGPDGLTDGFLHWTFAVATDAATTHYPGGRRYVCQRLDQAWAPHV
jgi:hypothetical protein